MPSSTKNNIETALDQLLLEYAKSTPKKPISKIPRAIAKILALLPIEVLIDAILKRSKK